MSKQSRSFQLSLLVHLLLVLAIGYGHQLLDKEPPPLVIDLSLSVSEAMAGEPDKPLGPVAAAPATTPTVAPSRPQPVHPPEQERPKPVQQPVKVAKPSAKPPTQKAKKKKTKPVVPMVEKNSEAAPLPPKSPARNDSAATPVAQRSAAAGQTATSSPAGTQAGQSAAQSGRQGGNRGKGSGVRYDFNYVRQRILSNLHFPSTARKMGLSGKIVVSFVLKTDGQVASITVVSSSGHAILDKSVIATIRRVAPFPKPPVTAQLMLPIVFHLKS